MKRLLLLTVLLMMFATPARAQTTTYPPSPPPPTPPVCVNPPCDTAHTGINAAPFFVLAGLLLVGGLGLYVYGRKGERNE